MCEVDFREGRAWNLHRNPAAREVGLSSTTFELDSGAEEICQLVALSFQTNASAHFADCHGWTAARPRLSV
jgi:hypothetical protein